jgi:hypothetical protein
MSRKALPIPDSTNILDYPSNLSMQEKEELVAIAKVKAAREKKKPKKSGKRAGPHRKTKANFQSASKLFAKSRLDAQQTLSQAKIVSEISRALTRLPISSAFDSTLLK